MEKNTVLLELDIYDELKETERKFNMLLDCFNSQYVEETKERVCEIDLIKLSKVVPENFGMMVGFMYKHYDRVEFK